ncbi:hypothetical protein FRB97_009418 [Tulasnella sp. 331]|nr:hypothetical protein FRB97_009418 [Tulasnella sp. 331]KAG8880201.1 hypothetical protein FRB98_005285 [Tulasnella sp. 332]
MPNDLTRILIAGKANVGKISILKKICGAMDTPIIRDREGNLIEWSMHYDPNPRRGTHDIENEITCPNMPGFVFHNSRGIECGSTDELDKLKDFIIRRGKMKLSDQLHVIWVCLTLDDARPLGNADTDLLSLQTGDDDFYGCVELSLISTCMFTKYDGLEAMAFNMLRQGGMKSRREALQAMPEVAEQLFREKWLEPIVAMGHTVPPYVILGDLHKEKGDCNELIKCTTAVLGHKPLQQGSLSKISPMSAALATLQQHQNDGTTISLLQKRGQDPEGAEPGRIKEEKRAGAVKKLDLIALASQIRFNSLQLSTSDAHLINIPHPNRSVGGGGYCDLFLGMHIPTGMKLAMKRPRFNTQIALEAATAKRRFVREANTWSRLNHENILPFYGLMEISNEMYLASPWMDYGDLSKFLQERIAFLDAAPDVQRAHPKRAPCRAFKEVDAIRGIALGLEYLHTHDVIHGDLKAVNILLTEQLDPLICDFGMTKIRDGYDATSTTLQGAGSYRWMSPELMCEGSKTKESDVYAFGMTIVEVLTGFAPLPRLSQVPFIRAIMADQRPPYEPSSRQGQDFEPLWRIASACWAPEPTGRPTASTVVRLIAQIGTSAPFGTIKVD